ncbi:hypothetical protein Tco_1196928 [Tanacetum coccineum]
MIQSDDAPRQIAWTNEEEIAMAKESKTKQYGRQMYDMESGASDEDYINMALIHYQAETGNTFKYRHCWEVLKDSLKWTEQELLKFATESGGGSKRHKSFGSSSFNTESKDASINLNTNVGDNDEDEGSSSMNDDALARLMVTEITDQEKEERLAFIGIKRREVECHEREVAAQGYRARQEDIRFYLLPYDHLTGEQRMAMDEARAVIKAKYNLQY